MWFLSCAKLNDMYSMNANQNLSGSQIRSPVNVCDVFELNEL